VDNGGPTFVHAGSETSLQVGRVRVRLPFLPDFNQDADDEWGRDGWPGTDG
jgi:hypothetical protein